MNQNVYTTGQFAKKASVTIRTLRYYDRVGLLSPSHYSEAGHRLYTDEDLVPLQQILSLKFLGFSLGEIKQFIEEVPSDFRRSLEIQKEILNEKKSHINNVVDAIAEIEDLPDGYNWDRIINLINVIQMKHNDDWWKKYYIEAEAVASSHQGEEWMRKTYTSEQLTRLRKRQETYTKEQAHADGQRWKELILQLKHLVTKGENPSSPKAQELAHAWISLVSEFTQGDVGISQSLERGIKAENNPFPRLCTTEEERFIEDAVAIYRNKE